MVTKSELTRVADNIRILSAAMVEKAKSGHPGGAMGGADFMAVLYTEFLRYDPDQMDYPFRDRFFLDPGHMSPMLYSTLALAGTYTVEDLRNLRQWGSVTPGHPEVDVLHGVENTSGPLGQGHAMALGAAIAERFLAARFGEWQSHKTYAYISDGGIEEEVSQGVGRIAGHLGMNNLIMYYDSNNVQLSTKVDEVDTENVAMKYEAWGWNVITIDGHDVEQIREALTAANAEKERPTLIIGRTVMGKGKFTKLRRENGVLGRKYYNPSLTIFALASPTTAAISSNEASLIRFTLLNSFRRAVLVFSPIPLMVSSADATCRLLRLSRWKLIAKRCTSS